MDCSVRLLVLISLHCYTAYAVSQPMSSFHKQNVALNRTTSQSSTLNRLVSDHAADGNTNIDVSSCAHTDDDGGSSWSVLLDQQSKYNITNVTLYLRDTLADRYKDLQVLVDGDLCGRGNITNTNSKEAPRPNPVFLKCDQPLPGHNVTVQVNNSYLTLCEVQIWVCVDGWFGEDCNKECRCNNTSEVCDKLTGYCKSGCADGWEGRGCQTECGNETYGPECSLPCGQCMNSSRCDHVSGLCNSGCEPGWETEKCHRECSNNTYGQNCSSACGHCLDSSPCHHVNGSCSGCAPGWRAQKCDQNCTDGTYGRDCNQTCGNCSGDDVCEPTNGVCPDGCQLGYSPPLCQTSCTRGTYGRDCSQTCGNCSGDAVCEPTSGVCPNGCQLGYSPPLCQTSCTRGTYGRDCSQTCGNCSGDVVCEPTSGVCPDGCQLGYSPPLCQTKADLRAPDNETYIPVVGAVCGVLLLLIVTLVIVFFIRRRKHSLQAESPRHGNNNISKLTELQNLEAVSTVNAKTASTEIYENAAVYYNCLPRNIAVDELQEYIQKKINEKSFETEFEALRYGIAGAHEAGKKPENKLRNRFIGLFPYDNTRVVLEPDGASTWDYINASFVPGYDDEKKYIAAQGPKEETVDDFWRMVCQQNVNKIVMLTRLIELNKKKCHQYWPDGHEIKQYGNISVQIAHCTIRADYTMRTFNIKHKDSPARKVTQYHFTSWPDHYVPETSALVRFWRLVKHDDTQTDTGLTVIHCSAGVGRTGTFIGLDSLYTEAETEGRVNVFMCVAKMREARMNMVQKEIQYQFLHEALLEAIKSRGTIYTMLEFEQRYGSGLTFDIKQEEDLQKEFQSLVSLRRDFNKENVSEALMPENVDKNRSVDILPANTLRPFLMTPVTGRTNYINAVMLPSVTRPRYFIVTQTPLQNTVIDFWRLVYDHDCFIIVCLEGSPDFSSLIPDESASTTVGPFQIQNLNVDRARDGFTKTTVEIQCHEQVDSARRLEIYKFFAVATLQPETETILQFIEVLQHSPAEEEQNLLVMCNDGSRQSGVFCSMMNIVSRLKLDKQVDVFLTIRQLQSVRPQFVQTFDQYKLCYSIVKEYSRASNVYANL